MEKGGFFFIVSIGVCVCVCVHCSDVRVSNMTFPNLSADTQGILIHSHRGSSSIPAGDPHPFPQGGVAGDTLLGGGHTPGCLTPGVEVGWHCGRQRQGWHRPLPGRGGTCQRPASAPVEKLPGN